MVTALSFERMEQCQSTRETPARRTRPSSGNGPCGWCSSTRASTRRSGRRSSRLLEKLKVNHESLRIWVRKAETDAGTRPGLTTDERTKMKELERENRRAAPGQRDLEGGLGFLRRGARPATAQIVAFIDDHRDRFGVEPICRVLTEHGCKIAPNTYWVAKKRPPSARAVRDEELQGRDRSASGATNLEVYGADKIWTQLNREGIRVARCTVERLMRDLGLSGARRGRAYKVTTRIGRAPAPPGRPRRSPVPCRRAQPALGGRPHLRQDARRLGLRRLHHRRVLAHGGRLADLESLRSDLAIDALEMAVWNRTRDGQVLDGLVHHSDKGVQYLSIRYSERLAENDIVASVGSTGDSYDNAMAEAFNSLYKWELIYPQGPWRGLDDVEFATLGYIDWFNHRRLHGEITDDNSYVTPAEFEATYYRQTAPALEAVTQTSE